jgi:hypothetical protein
MNCPDKDKSFRACDIIQHPHDENIFFCKVCQESFDVRRIRTGNESFFNSLLVIILSVILASIGITRSEQPVPSRHSLAPSPNQVTN